MIKRKQSNPRLSQCVEHNGLLYLSGQVPDTLEGDITTQTNEVLAKVEALLEESNSSKKRILQAQIWLKDIERDFDAFNVCWEEWVIAGTAPARVAVEANMARPNVLVEVMIIAAQKA